MNVICELLIGKLSLKDKSIKRSPDYQKALDAVNDLEERLFKRLEGKDREEFVDFSNATLGLRAEVELSALHYGFRLGARMIIELFYNSEAIVAV